VNAKAPLFAGRGFYRSQMMDVPFLVYGKIQLAGCATAFPPYGPLCIQLDNEQLKDSAAISIIP
jgi:hypothetical protein